MTIATLAGHEFHVNEEGFLTVPTEWDEELGAALAAQIGIGRRALRRALEVLEAEGRIWRHQGKGTFLGPRPPLTSAAAAFPELVP